MLCTHCGVNFIFILFGAKKEKYINITGKEKINTHLKEVEVAEMAMDTIILAIIIGTLAAIVYSLRILVLMERRIARIDLHMERIVEKIAKEEVRIEIEEKKIEKMIKRR